MMKGRRSMSKKYLGVQCDACNRIVPHGKYCSFCGEIIKKDIYIVFKSKTVRCDVCERNAILPVDARYFSCCGNMLPIGK